MRPKQVLEIDEVCPKIPQEFHGIQITKGIEKILQIIPKGTKPTLEINGEEYAPASEQDRRKIILFRRNIKGILQEIRKSKRCWKSHSFLNCPQENNVIVKAGILNHNNQYYIEISTPDGERYIAKIYGKKEGF